MSGKAKRSSRSFSGYFPGTPGHIKDCLQTSYGMFGPKDLPGAEAELRNLKEKKAEGWSRGKLYKVTLVVEEVKRAKRSR